MRSASRLAAVLAGAILAIGVANDVAGARPVAPARPSRTAVTAQDRSATAAYVQAELEYEKALVVGAPASKTALEVLAARYRSECPGVVSGVARQMLAVGTSSRSPRQQGEENRGRRQWDDLTSEAKIAVELARNEPYRQAALAFAHKVLALRWSDATVTAFEHATARAMEWSAPGGSPPVCQDMEAWVSSGKEALTSTTKVLAGEEEAAGRPLVRILMRMPQAFAALFVSPLRSYEGPRARALSRRIERLKTQNKAALTGVFEAGLQVEYALGVSSEAELKEVAKDLGGGSVPPKGAAVIRRGTTAAGSSYEIWVEPKHAARGSEGGLFEVVHRQRHCRLEVGFQESEPAGAGSIAELGGKSGTACLSRPHVEAPRMTCEDGTRAIEAQTVADARRVRLTLRNGRQITTRVALVAKRLGGPAGFYYQAVEGAGSAPVSLTELDGHGRPLRTVRLPRAHRCVVRSIFAGAGRARTIVSGRVPEGPGFSIFGRWEGPIAGPHVRLPAGQGEVTMQVELENELQAGGIQRQSNGRSPFEWRLDAGCQPHRFAILYGTLKDAQDTVWVRSSGGLTKLRRVALPASLHAHGVLAYAALSEVPGELVVRGPGGKTVASRKLAGIGREAREVCEGEAEPGAG